MDNERDGPFKVGDRVKHGRFGFTGTVRRVTDAATFVLLDPKCAFPEGCPEFDGCYCSAHSSLTLISPTHEPEAQEKDVEFKKGDWVEHRECGFAGTVVNDTDVKPDNLATAKGFASGPFHDGNWRAHDIGSQFRLITTEPVAAQKETTMKAYGWVIWNKDKDGKKLDIVDQGGLDAFADAEDAKMEIWAAFKAKAKNKGALKKDYVVEVVPFGG